MSENADYGHEIYHFAVCILRILNILCWLFQQLQQLTAQAVHWMDEERERRNRGESHMKVIDTHDTGTYDTGTYDTGTYDTGTNDIGTDDTDLDDIYMDDICVDDIDMNDITMEDIADSD